MVFAPLCGHENGPFLRLRALRILNFFRLCQSALFAVWLVKSHLKPIMMTDEQMARALLGTALLSSEQIQTAARARRGGERLSQAILRLEMLPAKDVLPLDPQALDGVSASNGHSNGHAGGEIVPNEPTKKVVVSRLGAPLVAPEIAHLPPPAPETVGISKENNDDLRDLNVEIVAHDDSRDPSQAPVVRWANEMLKLAIMRGASDVHFEPRPNGLLPRYRVDGALTPGQVLPPEISAPLIARFKVLGGLDITEQRLPQDGRFRAIIGKRTFDFRVSSLPSLHGEKVVLRLLDHSALVTDLGKLGFSKRDRTIFEAMLGRSHGMILVTGPTGSGKTTTLYAALASTRDEARNVLTIEDPIEYELEGVTQTSVNLGVKLSFAGILRATLRQDPDVILVGEIRDEETADIAVRAALTGHLLLSTLHTNSAVAAITRLQDMGVPSYLIASSLAGVLAQRLARLTCRGCRQAIAAEDPRRAEWGSFFNMDASAPFQEGTGCDRCGGRGTKGRVAIIEILEISGPVRRAILAGKDSESLRGAAREEGFRSLMSDAREKILAGFLSPAEAMKVLMGHEES